MLSTMTSATSSTGDTTGGSARRAPDTMSRLIGAAAEAFADKGFHATTTRDIAARAGLSPAGVYVHFSSKEDLLFQLSRQGHERALELVRAAGSRRASPPEQLEDIVSDFARWHAEHFRTARIVQYEFPHLSAGHRDEVLALRKQIDGMLRRVITAGVRSGDFAVPDVPGTTLALLSMCIDVARWFEPGTRRTPEAIGTAYGALALRLVRP
jgi:AcrR family transcriptional regulator